MAKFYLWLTSMEMEKRKRAHTKYEVEVKAIASQ